MTGGVVVGIRFAQGVRVDAQSRNELLVDRCWDDAPFLIPLQPRRPERSAAQRLLEGLDGTHRDGIGHLLVELWVGLGRREAILGQQPRVIEIDRPIETIARRIEVHDFDVFADRPGREGVVRFPRHVQRDASNAEGVQVGGQERVERKDPELARTRGRRRRRRRGRPDGTACGFRCTRRRRGLEKHGPAFRFGRCEGDAVNGRRRAAQDRDDTECGRQHHVFGPGGLVRAHVRQQGALLRHGSIARDAASVGNQLFIEKPDGANGFAIAQNDGGAVIEKRCVDSLGPLEAEREPRWIGWHLPETGRGQFGRIETVENRPKFPGQQLVQPGERLKSLLEVRWQLDAEVLHGLDRLVRSGDCERGREGAEAGGAEEDEVIDQAAGIIRAEELDRTPGDKRPLRVRDDVQWPGFLPEAAADQCNQALGLDIDVLAPVEAELLNRVATHFEVKSHQVVDDRDRAARPDRDAVVGVLFGEKVRIVFAAGGKFQGRELAAIVDQSRIEPNKPMGTFYVAQCAAEKARHENDVVGY